MFKFNCMLVGSLMMVSGLVFADDAAKAQGVASVPQKKVLVVYYSRTGNTKKVAEDVAKALGADIEQLIDKKDYSGAMGYMKAGKDATKEKLAELGPVKTDVSKYGLVVLGTPIWAWNMTPALRTYITNNKASLKDIAVFTTAGGSKPDKIVKKIEDLSGKKAKISAGFLASEINDKDHAKYDAKLNAFVAGLK